jgi:prolyl-tRNA synthetase
MSEELGVKTKRNKDFGKWYNEVVLKADLADFSSIKGFMVIKPYGYAIWEKIIEFLDKEFKRTGHKNLYFPAVIPEKFLIKEKEHVEGFAPEVFWVTHVGDNKLEERLALRPTSETIIYNTYSKWIRSWKDLPLLYNLWNSVFRAETKMTKLFLRTREFLWQEGHTAHRNEKEADEEVMKILNIYIKLMEKLLAIPVISGRKTESEKFAGAKYTMTIEGLMQDKKALQMGTSHSLGQNFSKPFNVTFLDKDKKKKYVWQTSWGVSTRLIGALVMVHGDDKGLILPPKIAPIEIVIIPIIIRGKEKKVLEKAKQLENILSKKFSIKLDDRDYSAGFKFNDWELRGVPLRIEIGPKDIDKKQVILVRRDTSEKKAVKTSTIGKVIKKELVDMQKNLFNKAKKFLKENSHKAESYDEFKDILKTKGGLIKVPWCESASCEKKIKGETGATARCLPLQKGKIKEKCIFCNKPAKQHVYFSKSY